MKRVLFTTTFLLSLTLLADETENREAKLLCHLETVENCFGGACYHRLAPSFKVVCTVEVNAGSKENALSIKSQLERMNIRYE